MLAGAKVAAELWIPQWDALTVELERALAACRRKRRAQDRTEAITGSRNYAGFPPWAPPIFDTEGVPTRTPGAGNIPTTGRGNNDEP